MRPRTALAIVVMIAAAAAGTAAAASVEPEKPVRIVVFGDGAIAKRPGIEKTAAQGLAEALRGRGDNIEVIDAAVDGNTTEQARRRFQWDVLDREPDLVVIQFGLDDAGVVPPDAFEKNLDHFVKAVRERGILVILATPSPLLDAGQPDPWAASAPLARYVAAVQSVADRRGLGLVDVYTFYREFVVDAREALELIPDGRHPGERGHAAMADLLVMMAGTLIDDEKLRPRDVARQPLRGPGPAPARGYSIPVIEVAGEPAPARARPAAFALAGAKAIRVFHDDGRLVNGPGERATTSRIYAARSSDGGQTWSDPEPILTHPAARLADPCIVRSTGGRRLAMIMGDDSGEYNALVSFSADEGATWSPPRELPGALAGARHAACGAPAPDGRLVVLFRDGAEPSPTRGEWVGWVGAFDDLEQGREGAFRLTLAGLPCGEGAAVSLEAGPDGDFVATCGDRAIRFRLPAEK